MINYDTIISNFDDKVTLYNWLRKVEEALKNASATNFVVNKKGNATLSFSITFADGETIESGDIVLQQGESVDQARIASGVLQLHLTNGTWLTAGNVKTVFGQSLIGTGNVDIYRHNIRIHNGPETLNLYLIYYSSSDLQVDSLNDLLTLFGVTTTDDLPDYPVSGMIDIDNYIVTAKGRGSAYTISSAGIDYSYITSNGNQANSSLSWIHLDNLLFVDTVTRI